MSTQNALIVSEIGKPLIKVTRPIPSPKEGELLVKITAAGINPHDQKVRDSGLFLGGKVPAILVNDVVGTISSIGPNVTGFNVDDHVFGQSSLSIDTGGLQQYAVLDAFATAHVPHNISDDEAATLPVNGFSIFVALFHSTGLGIPPPFPDSEEAKMFDYVSQSVVIIGGGSNVGKLGVQFASIVGIGKIIVIAGITNAVELKSYGATHIIDRHASNEEIKGEVQKITGDDLVYVIDTINTDHTLAASLLSSTKYGKVATLLPGKVDEGKVGEKTVSYRIATIFGSSHHVDFAPAFWKEFPVWLEGGLIKPVSFKVVEGGLSAEGVNRVLDEYRDGQYPGKWNVHPNA